MRPTRGGSRNGSLESLQFHSAEWFEQLMYGCAKIPVRRGVFVKGRPQDIPDLLLHGAPVLGRPDA